MSPDLFHTDWSAAGREMYQLARELFPLHRSITGDGVRATFHLLQKLIPLTVTEVPSGTQVFDWRVPQEWKIHDAWIAGRDGRRIVDYKRSNLHVVNYSRPVDKWSSWNELEPHLHWLPEQPDLIPYRTLYFRDSWGFCVTGQQLQTLSSGGPWQVTIQAEFMEGSLSLAEFESRGKTKDTCLFYCHSCHPSLANDNLSGMVVAAYLAYLLQTLELRYSYRFVFAPATIGAITWLAQQKTEQLDDIACGLVLSLLGDSHGFTYKNSRRETAWVDRLVAQLMRELDQSTTVLPFSPFGYDERQFCSPGIDLPVGRLTRSSPGEFPEYHTSADDLELVSADRLAESLEFCATFVEALERNSFPLNTRPCGEVQLGTRNLYRAFGEPDDRGRLQQAIMWVLNLSDGQHDLLAMAQRSGLGLRDIQQAVEILTREKLLEHRFDPAPEPFNRNRRDNA